MYIHTHTHARIHAHAHTHASSWSCVCVPTNLKVTDPLVNYSFSNDHIANLGPPCARIVIELQTTLLITMRIPQFPNYCI